MNRCVLTTVFYTNKWKCSGALNCLVSEKIAFFCILATDRQTNGQTDKQMDSIDALSCSRCRERRLDNSLQHTSDHRELRWVENHSESSTRWIKNHGKLRTRWAENQVNQEPFWVKTRWAENQVNQEPFWVRTRWVENKVIQEPWWVKNYCEQEPGEPRTTVSKNHVSWEPGDSRTR